VKTGETVTWSIVRALSQAEKKNKEERTKKASEWAKKREKVTPEIPVYGTPKDQEG